MIGRDASSWVGGPNPDRALGQTLRLSLAGAGAATLAGVAGGHWQAGLGLGAGLALGSVNGHLARRALSLDISFGMTSLARLLFLSVLGVGAGLVLGFDQIWLVILGLGAAQLILALVAAREAMAR